MFHGIRPEQRRTVSYAPTVTPQKTRYANPTHTSNLDNFTRSHSHTFLPHSRCPCLSLSSLLQLLRSRTFPKSFHVAFDASLTIRAPRKWHLQTPTYTQQYTPNTHAPRTHPAQHIASTFDEIYGLPSLFFLAALYIELHKTRILAKQFREFTP